MFNRQVVSIFTVEKNSKLKLIDTENLSKQHDNLVQKTNKDNPSNDSLESNFSQLFCSSCNVNFTDREEQISHYKSDWHRFNVKQKLKKQPLLTEELFIELVGNNSSLSSISGSDSESSDSEESDRGSDIDCTTSNNRNKFYVFDNSNGLIIVPRYLLYSRRKDEEEGMDPLIPFNNLLGFHKWIVLMGSAGHFAAAIFDGDTVTHHKTFHRYVVRAKRGSSQNKFDSQGKKAKSGGASLRRYNERALLMEIVQLIQSWEDEINSCQKIFIRASSSTRKAIFSATNRNRRFIIDKSDWRLSGVPLATKRPTLNEVKRVHQLLSSVEFYDCGVDEYLNSLSPTKIDYSNKEKKENIDIKETKKIDIKSPIISTSSDEDITGTKMALCWHNVEFDTSELKEVDCTKKRRRKKKPNKTSKDTKSGSKDSIFQELIAYCKTGVEDLDVLDHLLKKAIARNDALTLKNHNHDNVSGLVKLQINDSNSCLSKSNHSLMSEYREPIPDILGNRDSMNEFKQGTLSNAVVENKDLNNDCRNIILSNEIPNTRDFKTGNETSVYKYDKTILALNSKNTEEAQRTNSNKCTVNSEVESTNLNKYTVISIVESTNLNECKVNPKVESESNLQYLSKLYDGESLLHIASENGRDNVVAWLLRNGADPTTKNNNKQTAYQLVTDKNVRNEFRKFRNLFPDKYNYSLAKIPEPLTDEMIELRKEKNSIRKKTKKDKSKIEKEIIRKNIEEDNSKNEFTLLNDQQKINLIKKSNIVRCFQCAKNLTNIVPFEYFDFKFCSTVCLRAHKLMKT